MRAHTIVVGVDGGTSAVDVVEFVLLISGLHVSLPQVDKSVDEEQG